jgi:hypothetical protein
VPGDTPPAMRLLVRVAQQMGIPTFALNDGYKANDFEAECMTADHVLAWSSALAEHYFARRTSGSTIVTGNPKADARRAPLRQRRPRSIDRILVGGFSYVPVDLNCRRSDPEMFLDEVLGGIEHSALSGARVRVKLHPADGVEHYESVLAAHPDLSVEITRKGDILDAFGSADVYVTGASTSLLEAVASGLPVIYYRVNEQRMHVPFSGDPFIEQRTAASSIELAALLDRLGEEEAPDPAQLDAWCERYLGPRDGGSVSRIIDAIRAQTV